MTDLTASPPTQALAERRRDLAPDTDRAFREFGRHVFADGALPASTK